MIQGDITTSALAIYTVQIDPATLQATASLKETRAGQANDDIYFLSIDSFLNANSFKITGLEGTPTTLDLKYAVTHPFPAPNNPTGAPNGSTNRADLGISGMVLFLTDVASATNNTYFTDKVANTATVVNADAYYAPGGLMSVTGNANTFPYRALVDEVADSRSGVSNSGIVTGNFGTDGWTRAEFGTGNNGWTGYGVLHQGQTSNGVLSLDKASIALGFSLDVGIVAKYNDPRGGTTGAQKKANRLPPAAADSTLFAYRMPHGALDGASVTFEGESGGFSPNTISASTLSFHVVDWDATATETAAADLSADTSFTNVAVGESGAPTLEVCIPGVLGDATFVSAAIPVVDDDSAAGGDAAADDGLPGDEIYYTGSVTKVAGTGQSAGAYTGLARVTDPETGLSIGLDENLAPLPTAPEPVTYQAFPILMNNLPSATVVRTSADPMNSGTSAGVSVTAMADLDGDNLDVLVDWGDGGGFVTVAAGLVGPAYPNQTPSGPQMNNIDLVTDAIAMTVRLTDGVSNVDYPLPYTLGANRAPVIGGNPVLAATPVAPPATFTMNVGTATAVDPEGDAVNYLVTAATTPNGPFPSAAGQAAFPITGLGPYPTPGTVIMTVHARDPLHGNTATAQPDSTSQYAAINAVVQACPGLAYAGTNLTGGWGFNNYSWYGGINGSNATGGADLACWTIPTFGATSIAGGAAAIEQYQAGTAPTNPSWDIYAKVLLNSAQSASAPNLVIVTQLGAGFTRRMNQIEVGSDQVVFWSVLGAGYPTLTMGLTPVQNYGATGATPNISYGTYSGAAITTPSTINTGANNVIAMALGQNNDVFFIDQNHVMHRRIKASAYAEDTAAPFPMNMAPTIGTNAGVGDANRKVADFVIDYRNRCFILLVVSQDATAAGNMYIYRIECDGVFNASLAGNPNPRRFNGNTNTTQTVGYDIAIDQLDSSGNVLATQGEAQIVTCSYPGDPSFVGFRTFNSNLVATTTGGALGNQHQKLAFGLNNWMSHTYNNANLGMFTQPGVTFPTGWPTGWQ